MSQKSDSKEIAKIKKEGYYHLWNDGFKERIHRIINVIEINGEKGNCYWGQVFYRNGFYYIDQNSNLKHLDCLLEYGNIKIKPVKIPSEK